VKNIEKQWLSAVPWDRVLTLNRSLCETQKTTHELRGDKGPSVREMWEQAASKRMSLFEALDICRRCCDIRPFVFNNGNTFATVGKTLLEEWFNRLPSVEGEIARTTVGHYIARRSVGRRELHQVLETFGSRWHINGHEHPAAEKAAQLQVPLRGQVQPPVAQA
jgi:hypothetical protein